MLKRADARSFCRLVFRTFHTQLLLGVRALTFLRTHISLTLFHCFRSDWRNVLAEPFVLGCILFECRNFFYYLLALFDAFI